MRKFPPTGTSSPAEWLLFSMPIPEAKLTGKQDGISRNSWRMELFRGATMGKEALILVYFNEVMKRWPETTITSFERFGEESKLITGLRKDTF